VRRWKAVVAGCLAVLVAVPVGGVVLVRTGVVERVLGDCTDSQMRSAEIVADELRRELPGRTGSVEVDGYCWDEPFPTVGTSTSAERDVVIAELREKWSCRQQKGTLPPAWDCEDVGGQGVALDVYTDGDVIATVVGGAASATPRKTVA
jgi:hypothetical protein